MNLIIIMFSTDNVTYGMGFHNPEAVDTSVSLCDDLTKSVSAGEGNYFELAASGLSNTYESVTAGVYSELSAANSTTDTQVRGCTVVLLTSYMCASIGFPM